MITKALTETLLKYTENIKDPHFQWFIEYELSTEENSTSIPTVNVNLNKKESFTRTGITDVYSELINIIKEDSAAYIVEVDNTQDIFHVILATSNKLRALSRFTAGNICIISPYLFEKLETIKEITKEDEGKLKFLDFVEIFSCECLEKNEAIVTVFKDKKVQNPIKFEYIDNVLTYSKCITDRSRLVKINFTEKE